MFCPKCGHRRTSPDTSFCSGCGYLLTGTAELLEAGGAVVSEGRHSASPRSRGIKQGIFILLISFLIVPLIVLLTVTFHAGPFFVIASAFSLFMGGLLRIAYAAFFESSITGMPTLEEHILEGAGEGKKGRELHAGAAFAESPVGAGNWRDTADLQALSVTEGKTKLLEKDELL